MSIRNSLYIKIIDPLEGCTKGKGGGLQNENAIENEYVHGLCVLHTRSHNWSHSDDASERYVVSEAVRPCATNGFRFYFLRIPIEV